MSAFFDNHFDKDLPNMFRAAIERCDKSCDDLARQVHTSEKICFIDVGKAGGSREELGFLSDELRKRGCDTFVHDAKIYAWGDAFKEATRRITMESMSIDSSKDPEVEKKIWLWYFAFLP